MSEPMPRILIVDDHELAREGLRLALGQRGFDIAGTLSTAEDAIAFIRDHEPDLVLLDIRLGEGMDGLSAAREISALGSATKIMMLSLHDDPDYVRSALRAGARGYVLKDTALDQLCAEVRAVLAGGMAVPGELLSSVLSPPSKTLPEGSMVERLTTRERVVLGHVADGMTNKEIARTLSISPATVKAHVERVLAKLGAADRTQAAVMLARWNDKDSRR